MIKSVIPLFTTFFLTLLCISGCHSVSGNEEDPKPVTFEASIEGKTFEGDSFSKLYGDTLRVAGTKKIGECDWQQVYFRIVDFQGEGTYPIYQTGYVQSVGCDAVGPFGESPDTTGTATITSFDNSLRNVAGEFQFELTANHDFDEVKKGERFTVTGQFSSRIDTTTN